MSAFAVDWLGDIVFIELPEVGDTITKDTAFGSIEPFPPTSCLSGTQIAMLEQKTTKQARDWGIVRSWLDN